MHYSSTMGSSVRAINPRIKILEIINTQARTTQRNIIPSFFLDIPFSYPSLFTFRSRAKTICSSIFLLYYHSQFRISCDSSDNSETSGILPDSARETRYFFLSLKRQTSWILNCLITDHHNLYLTHRNSGIGVVNFIPYDIFQTNPTLNI